jgi:transcriptional regulator of PTS gene
MNLLSPRPGPAPRPHARALVLDCIRRTGEVARIDISARVGVSPATVTAITAELLDAGLIEAVSTDLAPNAKRGRPREALRIRAAARLVAGLTVGRRAITVLLTDFTGQDLTTLEVPLNDANTGQPCPPDALADQIVSACAAASAQLGLTADAISVLSIALAGHVDGATGHVHWSSSLTQRNVDLAALLARRIPCPVFIENDANLVAKAEQLFGEGRNAGTFVVITLEYGVGMGIVIDGALYRGARGCGAEFGHTKVALDGALCQCGQRGCLEAYAGEYALLRSGAHADLTALAHAAQSGDAAAQATLDRAGRFLAMGLANVINIFDPELLILATKTSGDHPLCSPAVLDQVAGMVVQVDAPLPRIVVHGWDDLIWAKGAAADGIEKISALAVRALGQG